MVYSNTEGFLWILRFSPASTRHSLLCVIVAQTFCFPHLLFLSIVNLVASGTQHVSWRLVNVVFCFFFFLWTIPLHYILVQFGVFLDFGVIQEACFMIWMILQMLRDSILAVVSLWNCDLVFQSHAGVSLFWALCCYSSGAQLNYTSHTHTHVFVCCGIYHLHKKNLSVYRTRQKYFLLAVGPPIVYKEICSP